MKTGKQTRVSSSGKTIEIKIPTSWGALTDRQLCYLASLTAMELLNADEVKTLFLTRMLTPKVRYKLGDAAALAELLPELDWMDTPPEEPIRPMPYGALKRWMHTFRACRSATICKLKITTKAICKPRNLKLWRH